MANSRRQSNTMNKLRTQRLDYAVGLHYGRIDEIAKTEVDKKIRSERLGVIVAKSIKKGRRIELADGSILQVRLIQSDGMIVLDKLIR